MSSITYIDPPLIPVLPNEIDTIILPFCDGPSVLQMLKVCKSWKGNTVLQKKAREERVRAENDWGKENGFDLKLIAILEKCGFFISCLPQLDFETVKADFRQRAVQNRQAGRNYLEGIGVGVNPDNDEPYLGTDYVDFLNTRHLSAPIMRFEHNGRPGLVMCLQKRATHEIGICTLFRRFPHTNRLYSDDWVVAPYQHIDRRLVPSGMSQFGNLDFAVFTPVLSGTDPEVELARPTTDPEVELARPTVASPLDPVPDRPSVFRALSNLIHQCFLFLYKAILRVFLQILQIVFSPLIN